MAIFSICGILIIDLLAFNSASSSYELFSIGCQLELEGKIPEAINYFSRHYNMTQLQKRSIFLSPLPFIGSGNSTKGLNMPPKDFLLSAIVLNFTD